MPDIAGHARGHVSVPADEIPPPHPGGHYTPPRPPPAGLDPVKWQHLSRKQRRLLIRYHRKQVKR